MVAIATIFVGIVSTVGRLGIGPAVVQRPELTPRRVASRFAVSVGLGLSMGAALWAMAPVTERFFDDPQAPAALAALSAVFLLTGLGEVSEHLLHRGLRFRQLMLAGIVAPTAGYGLMANVMALAGHGVCLPVAGALARQALFTAAVVAFRPPLLWARPSRREACELLRFGIGLSVNKLLGALAGQGAASSWAARSASRRSGTTFGPSGARRRGAAGWWSVCCFRRWPNPSGDATGCTPCTYDVTCLDGAWERLAPCSFDLVVAFTVNG